MSATVPFIDAAKGRTAEGFFNVKAGLQQAIARGLAYAPYADLVWCETAKPDLAEAREFAEGIHAQFPGKLLAYNCSPSFNWKRKLDDARSPSSSASWVRWATLPVHHAGRLPRAQLLDVRAGARLQGAAR